MAAKLRLVQTCGGCPESYAVYRGEERVGYMHLRHGYFHAEYHGEDVYAARPRGDGVFEWDERDYFLSEGCRAILAALSRGPDEEELYSVEYE